MVQGAAAMVGVPLLFATPAVGATIPVVETTALDQRELEERDPIAIISAFVGAIQMAEGFFESLTSLLDESVDDPREDIVSKTLSDDTVVNVVCVRGQKRINKNYFIYQQKRACSALLNTEYETFMDPKYPGSDAVRWMAAECEDCKAVQHEQAHAFDGGYRGNNDGRTRMSVLQCEEIVDLIADMCPSGLFDGMAQTQGGTASLANKWVSVFDVTKKISVESWRDVTGPKIAAEELSEDYGELGSGGQWDW